jgi:hypothetical protein
VSQYTVDLLQEMTISKTTKNITELEPKFQNLNIQNDTSTADLGPNSGMYTVETAVFEWLESELDIILDNAHTYHTQAASAASSSLQLSFVCSILVTLSCQLEALIWQQSEALTDNNFTDYSSTPISLSLPLPVPPVIPPRDLGSVPGIMITGGTGGGTGSIGAGTGLGSGTNGAHLVSLRSACSRALSKYRGASLSLLSCDAVRDTSRFRCGIARCVVQCNTVWVSMGQCSIVQDRTVQHSVL